MAFNIIRLLLLGDARTNYPYTEIQLGNITWILDYAYGM